jgi:hypothetical protein
MDVLGTYKDEPVIFQSKPQRRTIFCFYYFETKFGFGLTYKENAYFLQFPYIIFCKYPFNTVTLPNSYLRVGFSPEPISSLDTEIYLPPLPNTGYYNQIFATCGCQEDDLKMSIGQFWQKSFKTNEIDQGEKELCQMFGLKHSKHSLCVDTAFRQWEKLDLVSFNKLMINFDKHTNFSNFLEIPSLGECRIKWTF